MTTSQILEDEFRRTAHKLSEEWSWYALSQLHPLRMQPRLSMYAKRELWCSAASAEALTFEPENYSAVLSDPNGYNAYLHS